MQVISWKSWRSHALSVMTVLLSNFQPIGCKRSLGSDIFESCL